METQDKVKEMDVNKPPNSNHPIVQRERNASKG
jgi:hypothetical protein